MTPMLKRDQTAASGQQNLPGLEQIGPSIELGGSQTPPGTTPTAARAVREQDLPVRAFEWLNNSSPSQPVSDGAIPGHLKVGDPALQARLERLESLITREVVMVRTLDAESLNVVLRPDSRTELHLQVQRRGGQIEAELRCEQGDFAALNAHWGLLRDSLAEQQVRLLPLRDSHPDWPPGQGHAASQHRAGDGPAHEQRRALREPAESLVPANPAEPVRPHATRSRSSGHRGWETWA